MWKVDLKPEIKRTLKNPEKFAQGISTTYTGITIAMCGVVFMLILYFNKPEHVLRPTWIMLLGLLIAGWGELQKYRAK